MRFRKSVSKRKNPNARYGARRRYKLSPSPFPPRLPISLAGSKSRADWFRVRSRCRVSIYPMCIRECTPWFRPDNTITILSSSSFSTPANRRREGKVGKERSGKGRRNGSVARRHPLSSLSLSFYTHPAATEPDSRQSSCARSDPSQLLPIIWVLGFTPTGSTTCPAGTSPPVTRARSLENLYRPLQYRRFS